jgi:hypothetical protein
VKLRLGQVPVLYRLTNKFSLKDVEAKVFENSVRQLLILLQVLHGRRRRSLKLESKRLAKDAKAPSCWTASLHDGPRVLFESVLGGLEHELGCLFSLLVLLFLLVNHFLEVLLKVFLHVKVKACTVLCDLSQLGDHVFV